MILYTNKSFDNSTFHTQKLLPVKTSFLKKGTSTKKINGVRGEKKAGPTQIIPVVEKGHMSFNGGGWEALTKCDHCLERGTLIEKMVDYRQRLPVT